MSRVSDRSKHCRVLGATDFTAKDGSAATIFWGEVANTTVAMFYQRADGSDVISLGNVSNAGASARATAVINKGIL